MLILLLIRVCSVRFNMKLHIELMCQASICTGGTGKIQINLLGILSGQHISIIPKTFKFLMYHTQLGWGRI